MAPERGTVNAEVPEMKRAAETLVIAHFMLFSYVAAIDFVSWDSSRYG